MESSHKVVVVDNKYGESGWALWVLTLASTPFIVLFFFGLSYLIFSGTIATTLIEYVLVLFVWIGSGYAIMVGVQTIIIAPSVIQRGMLSDELEVTYFYGKKEAFPYSEIREVSLGNVTKLLWRSVILERDVNNLIIDLRCGKTIYLSGSATFFSEFTKGLMQKLPVGALCRGERD